MIKARTILSCLLAACLVGKSSISFAAPQSIELTKGHVVDILMLTNNADINELRNNYFKDIYPPAKEPGYNPAAGFRIKGKPASGYYSPDVLAIDTWPGDWEQRKIHFQKLQGVKPDIRSRRLDISVKDQLTMLRPVATWKTANNEKPVRFCYWSFRYSS